MTRKHRTGRTGSLAVGAVTAARGWAVGLLGVWLVLFSVPLITVVCAEETIEARRQAIASMTDAEKEELLWKRERFNKLDPAEQQRLRRLCRQVESDPQSQALLEAMDHYYAWLSSLSPYVRAELRELEPEARMERIAKLRADQAKRQSRKLSADEVRSLFAWMEAHALKQGEKLFERVPKKRRQQIASMPSSLRQPILAWILWNRWQSNRSNAWPPIDAEELAELRGQFSEQTQQRLEPKSTKEQWKIVAHWIRRSLHHQFAHRRGHRTMLALDAKQLEHIFQHDLNDQQRDRLLSLPPGQMQRELQMKLMDPLMRDLGKLKADRRRKPPVNPTPRDRKSPPGHPSENEKP